MVYVPPPKDGETVSHCNRRTEYEYIEHPYAPDKCDECAIIRDISQGSWLDYLKDNWRPK